MTQDEIIKLAKQAGGMFSELPMMDAWVFDDTDKSLEAFANLVAQHAKAEEREACANLRKEAELLGKQSTEYEEGFWDGLQKYEDLIRARGDNK
jgi:hypothetical protein